MIKINLLTVERKVAKKKFAFQDGQKITIGCSVLLIATALLVGWRYWSLGQESVKLDQDISAAQKEAVRLRSIITQVQQFEQRKTQLQERVTLIEQLRRGQTGPVHILDEVSKALPDRLWLVSMSQRAADFTIEGRTTSLTGVSDFVTNLQASTWFGAVELLDSQVDQTPAGDIVRFTLRATAENPEAPPAPAAPAGRGAPPAR